ncbi:MAG: hypothetical protein RIQ89_2352 [Bacteroidota bacterium]|jgi:rare lipoprotein A
MLSVKNIFYFFLICSFPAWGQLDSSDEHGKASFYAGKFEGRATSNGEIFEHNDFTAAHRFLPFNTIVAVTNKQNLKTVIVRINDRGPFKKSRIIDLTKSAAKKLNMVPFGVVPVRIKVLNLLDYVSSMDTIMQAGEYWNCYGAKTKLHGNSLYLWNTSHLKHAFYMASAISLDYKINDVVVKVSGVGKQRYYTIIATGLKGSQATLIQQLKQDGFSYCRNTKQ